MNSLTTNENTRRRRGQTEFSYKFQRLRERIRQSVASGALSGKLPGERELARQFQVNAKTLSKALTDLAAEGLLSRSIGRGTFVKGTQTGETSLGRWMIVCDPASADWPANRPLIEALRRRNGDLEVVQNVTSLRPSFLNQFSAVVDLGRQTPDIFVRDLLVRNMPVVAVGREPKTYSTSAVLLDTAYLAGRLGRELLMAGHRRLAAIGESPDSNIGVAQGNDASPVIAKSLRAAACRYAPDATVQTATTNEVINLIDSGVTALVCDGVAAGTQVRSILADAGILIPSVVSVLAIGVDESKPAAVDRNASAGGAVVQSGPVAVANDATTAAAFTGFPCSGFYISADEEAESVVHLLQHARGGGSSSVLWLTGKYVEVGTSGAASAAAGATPPILTLTA